MMNIESLHPHQPTRDYQLILYYWLPVGKRWLQQQWNLGVFSSCSWFVPFLQHAVVTIFSDQAIVQRIWAKPQHHSTCVLSSLMLSWVMRWGMTTQSFGYSSYMHALAQSSHSPSWLHSTRPSSNPSGTLHQKVSRVHLLLSRIIKSIANS